MSLLMLSLLAAAPLAPADPLELCYQRLTEAGRARVGKPLAQLTPGGKELAEALLKPSADGQGPLTADEVKAQTTGGGLAANRSRAALVAARRVSLLGGYPVQELGDPLDWYRAPEGDWQWPTHLSRHYWLEPAAFVYHGTGDAAAAKLVVEVLLDWVARFPLLSDNGGRLTVHGRRQADDGREVCESVFAGYVDGPWTSLSAHARVDCWSRLLQLIWDAPALDNRAVAILLNSLMDDHRRCMLAFPRAMNQFQGVATSLIHLGAWYPLLDGAAAAEDVGWQRMAKYAETEIYPDGSVAECSPNYGLGCVTRLHQTVLDGARRGRTIPPLLTERVRLAMRYYAFIADPLGRSPRIAKGGGSIRGAITQLNATYGDPEVAWVASGGKQGQAPRQQQHLFAWAGHAALRSGWSEPATWLFFEPGPRGSGHHDLACLNIELISHGEWLLCDPGYYTYSSTGEPGAMYRYLSSTAAHNAALVDGQGQHRAAPGGRGGPNAAAGSYLWRDDGQQVQVSGSYDWGYGPGERIRVKHTRTITYDLAADRFTIEDRFDGAGRHQVELRWQLPATAEVTTTATGAMVLGTKARLDLACSSAAPLQLDQVKGSKLPLAGWFSETYGKLTPAPLLRVSTTGELPLTIRTELRPGRR